MTFLCPGLRSATEVAQAPVPTGSYEGVLLEVGMVMRQQVSAAQHSGRSNLKDTPVCFSELAWGSVSSVAGT